MDGYVVRTVLGLLLAGLLVLMARRSGGQVNRQRGFLLAAGAFLAMALLNGWLSRDPTIDLARLLLIGLGLLLFAASLFFLVRAWRAGELRTGQGSFAERMRQYGEQRESERRK